MNANATILHPFPASPEDGKGGFVRWLRRGEVWPGTLLEDGVFLFHVPDSAGKLHLQKLVPDFKLVKITPYSEKTPTFET